MMFCSIQCNKLLTNSCGLLSTDCISSIPLSCKSLSLKEFLHKQSQVTRISVVGKFIYSLNILNILENKTL